VPVTLDKRFTVIVRQSTVAFLDGSKIPSSFGHGTMVAGMVRLAAPTAKIMPLKAFRADGRSDLFHIAAAIYYATSRGAKVVNMSFSLPTESAELTRAINFAAANGTVCVSSAGNQGSSAPVYPAISPNVIGVASVSNTGARSAFSNYGTPLVSLAAPGEGVLTTFPGGTYAAAWGTSYSAPLVAGTIAVIAQDQPGLTQSQAEFAVRQATPLSPELGAGMLNVPMALGMVPSAPPAPSAPGSTSAPSSSVSATAVNRSQGARCLTSSGAGRSSSACAIR
jgi:subtilisin family serine protease